MKDYYKDKQALSVPWVESPFFYSLIDTFDLTEKEREMCIQYHEKGYIEIDLELTDEEINLILDDMYKFIDDKNTVFHAEHYQYTQSKRIFELWKQSKVTAKLCINKKRMAYDAERLLTSFSLVGRHFTTIN